MKILGRVALVSSGALPGSRLAVSPTQALGLPWPWRMTTSYPEFRRSIRWS